MSVTTKLHAALQEHEAEAASLWPEVVALLPPESAWLSQAEMAPEGEPASGATSGAGARTDDLTRMTTQEHAQLLSQLSAVAALPPGRFDRDTAQTLSRQLSYVLQVSVSFGTDEQHLTTDYGTLQSLPVATAHRPSLWPPDPAQPDAHRPPSGAAAAWSVAVHPHECITPLQTGWQPPWFLYQSVLLINPNAQIALVAQITDMLTSRLQRYQYGASPAVIQAGRFWAPGNHGKVIICFLHQPLPNGTLIRFSEPRAADGLDQ